MKKNLIMVDGNSSFARDINTGTIVNINKEEIIAAREAKKRRKNKDAEFEQLKNDVSEMKELLNKLVEKL